MSQLVLDVVNDAIGRGIQVFPCGYKSKSPATKNGFYNSSSDPLQIETWFSNGSRYNPAFRCGKISGFFVIDIDCKNGKDGYGSLAAMEKEYGKLPDTLTVLTPSGGRHLYFRYPDGCKIKDREDIKIGIDIKSDGGYVMAPAAQYPGVDGAYYKYKIDPRGQAIADLPDRWIEALKRTENKIKTDTKAATGKEPEIIKVCLKHLPAKYAEDYRTWLRVGFICHPFGLFDAWDEWSKQSAKYGGTAEKWDSLGGEYNDDPVTIGSLIHWVEQENGGERPEELEKLLQTNKTKFPTTDSTMAERWAEEVEGEVVFNPERNSWMGWDGRRYTFAMGRQKAVRSLIKLSKKLQKESVAIEDAETKKACFRAAVRLEANTTIKNVLAVASTLEEFCLPYDEMDANPDLLTVLNGTIDLRTGQLRDHDKKDKITKLAPVEYDQNAQSAKWEQLLSDSMGGDSQLIEFLQYGSGYSITGSTDEEVFFFIHGPTASGKSTFLESVKAALGDYAQTADFEIFLKKPNGGSGIKNEIAALNGSRFVVSIEVNNGQALAEGIMTQLTGGDTVRARFLYNESFEFRPQCKLWLAANHAPKINADDGAMWRRILRIPFEHTVPEENRDPTLKAFLRDPKGGGPAILRWLVEGAIKWRKSGLTVPQKIKDATNEYRQDMDPLRDFVDEYCQLNEDCRCSVAELRGLYEQFCKESGQHWYMSARDFNQRVEALGAYRKAIWWQGRTQKVWHGIGVLGGENA